MKALISVFDKTGVIDFAQSLHQLGFEILSTGGTAKILRENGVLVTDVADVTQFPEMMEGRVKTLHPKIHGGILAKRQEHAREILEHNIQLIDLVCVSLYPFSKVIQKETVSLKEAIENIDIGGPALLRAAAKNYADVMVVSDISQYQKVIEAIKNQSVTSTLREELAMCAFSHTAKYDALVEKYLRKTFTGEEMKTVRLRQIKPFQKYAENWHQKGFVSHIEAEDTPFTRLKQVHGIEMGYNNYLDVSAAIDIASEFSCSPSAVIIKHTNPCGLATSDTLENALERAWQSDAVSAFGSIIALNRRVEKEVLHIITERLNPAGKKGWFVEVIAAPSFSEEALDYVRSKPSKKALRLLETGDLSQKHTYEYRGVSGGMLIQEPNTELTAAPKMHNLILQAHQEKGKTLGTVTKKKFLEKDLPFIEFGILSVKHIKSNAIVILREYKPGYFQILGMGAGQPNRKNSMMIALNKAQENLHNEWEIRNHLNREETLKLERLEKTKLSSEDYVTKELSQALLVSDAFFPFPDGLIEALDEGICKVVQPGGSKNDEALIQLADEYGAAMCFTGMRHFKH